VKGHTCGNGIAIVYNVIIDLFFSHMSYIQNFLLFLTWSK